MAALNLSALQGPNFTLEGESEVLNRKIYRYRLPVSRSEVAEKIKTLLTQNPQLIFVSEPSPPETLQQVIERSLFLVINDKAVCLSKNSIAPDDIKVICKDIFFSMALIKEPVQCSQNHIFEKEYILGWRKLQKNRCPYETKGKHDIHSFDVDEYLKLDILSQIKKYEDEQEIKKKTDTLAISHKTQNDRIKSLEKAIRPDRIIEVVGDGIKLSYKCTIFGIRQSEIGLKAIESFGKNVPVVSLAFGIILALQRINRGRIEKEKEKKYEEFTKAALELASGVAAFFPGFGTAASLLIDSTLSLRDFFIIYEDRIVVLYTDYNSHRLLGLFPYRKFSKSEIDAAFRKFSRDAHPDPVNFFGEHSIELGTDLQQVVATARDNLYSLYGYDK